MEKTRKPKNNAVVIERLKNKRRKQGKMLKESTMLV